MSNLLPLPSFGTLSLFIYSLLLTRYSGAFEFAGQKCSAASRAYIPKSIWPQLKQELTAQMADVKMGNPEDPSVLVNAVIDEGAADRCSFYIDYAKKSGECEVQISPK